MTADLTIHATPDQAAAVERYGFLVMTAPTEQRTLTIGFTHQDPMTNSWSAPVPSTKPCPDCGGTGDVAAADEPEPIRCYSCNGDGTVPIVVEVVVDGRPETFEPRHSGAIHDVSATIVHPSARTILRGTVEVVPVVDECSNDGFHICESPGYGVLWHSPLSEPFEDGQTERHVTDHFTDARPEVGDEAWIIREEGS